VPRYKALAKLERESQQKLEDLVALYDRRLELISEDVRAEAMQLLRSPGAASHSECLGSPHPRDRRGLWLRVGRCAAEMNADPARASATDLFMARMPELDALLKDPAVRQRNEVEWLYDQTVGRFDKSHLTWHWRSRRSAMEGTVSGSLRNRRVHCAPAGPEDTG